MTQPSAFCREVQERILAGSLEKGDRWSSHLEMCLQCRDLRDHVEWLSQSLRPLSSRLQPSEERLDAILRAIRASEVRSAFRWEAFWRMTLSDIFLQRQVETWLPLKLDPLICT